MSEKRPPQLSTEERERRQSLTPAERFAMPDEEVVAREWNYSWKQFVEALTDETRVEKLKQLIAEWEDEDE